MSQTGRKGVRLVKDKYYAAVIRHRGATYHLGMFPTTEDASRAYDEAARRLHGEFARPNAA